ncbi:hypothetical protein EDC01DRAFT_776025 [Geopyxis carbonaria]|nr:hypothetical protein EDC01DRAFT_776025 [Geopyxis carbonaria]
MPSTALPSLRAPLLAAFKATQALNAGPLRGAHPRHIFGAPARAAADKKKQRRGKWPWVAVLAVVLGGGGAAGTVKWVDYRLEGGGMGWEFLGRGEGGY